MSALDDFRAVVASYDGEPADARVVLNDVTVGALRELRNVLEKLSTVVSAPEPVAAPEAGAAPEPPALDNLEAVKAYRERVRAFILNEQEHPEISVYKTVLVLLEYCASAAILSGDLDNPEWQTLCDDTYRRVLRMYVMQVRDDEEEQS